jgi:serine/threonine protein kinase
MPTPNNYNITEFHFNKEQIRILSPERYDPLTVLENDTYSFTVKAWDNDNNKYVLLKKVFNPLSSAYDSKKIYREFALASKVRHKNILTIIDAYTPQDDWTEFNDIYFVYPNMDTTLRILNTHNRSLLTNKKTGAEFVGFLVYQLLLAVRFLHQQKLKLVHRDIRPDNIYIIRSENDLTATVLKLADIGSARQHSPSSDEVVNIYPASYPYRSPETILTDSYESSVDIWSAGCVLAELIIGRPTFQRRSSFNLIFDIVSTIGLTDTEISELPDYLQIKVRKNPEKFKKNKINEMFDDFMLPNWDKQGINGAEFRNLLNQMLVYDPKKRSNADELLKLPVWGYLKKSPEPNIEAKAEYVEGYGEITEENSNWKSKFNISSKIGSIIVLTNDNLKLRHPNLTHCTKKFSDFCRK